MQLTLTRPDDWHLHLREGAALRAVLPYTAARFARAIVMPNLMPPVTTLERARAYRAEILEALPSGSSFEPLMTLYLTDATTAQDIATAHESGDVAAVKLYPAGATTNSSAGVTSMAKVRPALEAMQRTGLPLLVHGEVTDEDVDVFDRERVFIDRVMMALRRDFPALRIVFEHITTADAAALVSESGEGLAATITPQHLLLSRNQLLAGRLRPHHYCAPVLKREDDRKALVEAATSGNARFFLGTDSAPHARGAKECAAGCAGVFTAHAALELYAEVFDAVGALNRLEGFASHHGPDFYGLPRNTEHTTLTRTPWRVPDTIQLGDDVLVPMRAGQSIAWQITDTVQA